MEPLAEKPTHPTKAKLLETVDSMLDEEGFDEVGVEHVLEVSGISRGSLYYHFEDFPDLVEQALVERFAKAVDQGIELIARVVLEASSAADVNDGLKRVTRITQGDAQRPFRFERSRLLGLAEQSERLRERLRVEQDRLTAALADLFREAQEKGWLNSDFEPRAGAVLIQAYTLGKVVYDVTSDPVPLGDWNSLIDLIMERALGPGQVAT